MTVRNVLFALAAAALAGCASAPAPLETTTGYITTDDGVDLYYVSRGDGPETVVAPVALYLEDHLLEPLSANRRVIFYDPRHRGRSGQGDLENATLDRQVADLENLRLALGLERFALIGWSGPGMEMAVYALRHPDRVTRLVQMSAVPPAAAIMREAGGDTRGDEADREAVEALDKRFENGDFDDAPADYCRARNALTNPTNFADRSYANEVADVCVYENEWPINLWKFFGAFLPSFGDYDWRDELEMLETPRLVIHGAEDGIPLAGAYAWAAGYDNARLLVLSPAGHFPFIEQRNDVIAAIETFLSGEWPAAAELVAAQE